ncbi:hypothetical protein MAR_019478 [Mya arenaria]|uniref:Chitin-binding type-2 domain-containing protein n=1 Tax=Mya arenaria TaxID=6604 RepID=A0ABY7E4J3_MYAAR|nr:uncharacterized protein LOC128236047 [Mya arenaria]WAR04109.1 hypothetical protein MAR_019478 [Mya arenaria]
MKSPSCIFVGILLAQVFFPQHTVSNLLEMLRFVVPKPAFFQPKDMPCVSSCRGVANGDYPSCTGCNFFTTCSNGAIYPSRPCSWFGGLFWNDDRKSCDWYPTYCKLYTKQREPEPGECLKAEDCQDVPNGDYQSCRSCYVYITCSNGVPLDERNCPWFLVWDDVKKRCLWGSGTCKPTRKDAIWRRNYIRELHFGKLKKTPLLVTYTGDRYLDGYGDD